MEQSVTQTMPDGLPDHAHSSHLPSDAPPLYQRNSSSSMTPTQAAVTETTKPRNSSQPATTIQQPQSGPHVQFQEQGTQHPNASQSGKVTAQDGQKSDQNPPPSPRLEPKHSSMLSLNGSAANSPGRIKVRDLNHIQSFASEEVLSRSRHPSRHSLRGKLNGGQQYEISSMPVQDIIEMVASLLTKITTTNDRQHEHLHRHIPPSDGSPALTQQATSVLAFHGKNVPSITISNYLNRIHKYCPTTYEVFLSLLVYFDRMTEMVNSGTLRGSKGKLDSENRAQTGTPESNPQGPVFNSPFSSCEYQLTSVDDDAMDISGSAGAAASFSQSLAPGDAYDISHFFVVDSFNIHRLVMAGVTCASKFFSDVFYTNSRYAKVSA